LAIIDKAFRPGMVLVAAGATLLLRIATIVMLAMFVASYEQVS
jgi:hypothetical protein